MRQERRGCPRRKRVHARIRRAMRGHDESRVLRIGSKARTSLPHGEGAGECLRPLIQLGSKSLGPSPGSPGFKQTASRWLASVAVVIAASPLEEFGVAIFIYPDHRRSFGDAII